MGCHISVGRKLGVRHAKVAFVGVEVLVGERG